MVTNSEINEPPDKPTSENDLRNKATSGRNFKSRLRTRLQFIGGRSPNLPLLARSLAASLVIGMAAMVNLSFASGIFCRDDPQNGSHTAKTLSGHGADVPFTSRHDVAPLPRCRSNDTFIRVLTCLPACSTWQSSCCSPQK
jgi:hypothetical protein